MLSTLKQSGLIGFAILLIGLTCLFLISKASWRAKAGDFTANADSRKALLFWGASAVLLGFIGHTVGLFTVLAIMAEGKIVEGPDIIGALRLCLFPVVMGLGILALAGAGWFGLGVAERKAAIE